MIVDYESAIKVYGQNMNVSGTQFILKKKWFCYDYTGFWNMAEFKLVEENAF